jgi:hypothetical protein
VLRWIEHLGESAEEHDLVVGVVATPRIQLFHDSLGLGGMYESGLVGTCALEEGENVLGGGGVVPAAT